MKFYFDSKLVKTLSVNEMEKSVSIETRSVYNPNTRSYEKFKSFDFKELLDLVYGKRWKEAEEISFFTSDNYVPFIPVKKFLMKDSFLAFDSAYGSKFTTVGKLKDQVHDLEPFYLIWEKGSRWDLDRSDWPFKIVGISAYSQSFNLIPKSSEKIQLHGYKLFKKYCIACHQVKGVGGIKGSNLLKSEVLQSSNRARLIQYIIDPKSVNKSSKMPFFPKRIRNKKAAVDSILQYLQWLDDKKTERVESPSKKKKIFSVERLNNALSN